MRRKTSRTGHRRAVREAHSGLCVALAAVALTWSSLANAQGADGFHRGIALFHPMIHDPLEPGPAKRFAFPPFSDPKDRLTDAQLSAIRKAGFDFVRLPVNPGPFMQFKGAQRDAIDDMLRERVQMIANSGLAVIVDFHPEPQNPAYDPKLLVQSVDAPVFKDYCAMLARTAKLLASLGSDRIALELMNEPPVGWSRAGFAAWQNMLPKFYHAARDAAPHLTLVISGANGSNYDGLMPLDPTPFKADDAVIYTFHYYFPYEFTMQSDEKKPKASLMLDLPYPANARPMSDSLTALSARLDQKHASFADKTAALAQATIYLGAYEATDFDRSTIHSAFDQVSNWAVSHGIPPSRIFLGEFGVIRRHDIYHGARDDERAAWLRDVREEAEAHKFSWSLWVLSGTGGMEITDAPDWTNLDPMTLRALGLQ
jgi:endoglucanase